MSTISKGGVPPVNEVFDIARHDGDMNAQRERSQPRNHQTAFEHIMSQGVRSAGDEMIVVLTQPEETSDLFGAPMHPIAIELDRQRRELLEAALKGITPPTKG